MDWIWNWNCKRFAHQGFFSYVLVFPLFHLKGFHRVSLQQDLSCCTTSPPYSGSFGQHFFKLTFPQFIHQFLFNFKMASSPNLSLNFNISNII